MQTKQILTLLCAIITIALSFFSLTNEPFADEESSDALVRKLQQTLTELRMKRQERYTFEEKARQKKALLREEINLLTTEKERLLSQYEQLTKEKNKLQNEYNDLKKETAKIDTTLNDVTKCLEETYNKILTKIDTGIPYRLKQRKELLSNFKENISKDVAANVSFLWQILMQECELGFSSEIYPGQINLPDNRKKDGWYLRVGKIIFTYITDDKKECGIAVKKNGKFELITNVDAKQRNAIEKALQIMRKTHSPALIIFSVYSTVNSNGENK
ncbi:MAG: DUF3450 family protein [Planctomycetota bacterium]